MEQFGLFSSGSAGSPNPSQPTEVEDIYSGKKRLVDFIYQDIKQFRDILGNDGFQVMEETIESIDAIGKTLQSKILEQGGGSLGSIQSCTENPLGPRLDQMKTMSAQNAKWYHLEENLPLVAEVNKQIMINAFACGAQVGLMQFGCGHSAFGFRFSSVVIPPGEHHGASHGKAPAYRLAQKAIVQEVADIATALKGLNQANGRSILDDTAIVISSCMGDSDAHDGRNVPSAIIGGAGGALNSGQFINLNQNDPGSHNRLLTTVARALGHDEVDKFGINVNRDSTQGVGGVIPGVLSNG